LTELLYVRDSYVRDFDALVDRIEGDGIVLDRTAFYPRGGGQPGDRGTLMWDSEESLILGLRKMGADVMHLLGGELPDEGTKVRGVIEWERRYASMRYHTALHILSKAVFDLFGGLVTGSRVYLDRARMDFDLDTLDQDRVQRIEEVANRVIWEGREVSFRFLPREEALQIPDLIRTRVSLLPPTIRTIRVVEIAGFDVQADGGTHVENTKEVGRTRIVKTINKGRLNRRIEIVLEPWDAV